MRVLSKPLPEPELSGPQLASQLGVKSSTVRWWRRNGAPSITYNGKMIRYRLSEIQAWLRNSAPLSRGPKARKQAAEVAK